MDIVLRCIQHERMDARMTKRRNFSDKFKAAVALEAPRGDETVVVTVPDGSMAVC